MKSSAWGSLPPGTTIGTADGFFTVAQSFELGPLGFMYAIEPDRRAVLESEVVRVIPDALAATESLQEDR